MTHASSTAVLVIDVQRGMFNAPEPVHDGTRLLTAIGDLIHRARAAETPVIFVQHRGHTPQHPLYPAGPGFEVHPAIAPLPGETRVQKDNPDSFQDTSLQTELEKRGIKNVVVCGIQSDLCVDTTIRAAYSRGLRVTLASDAHSTWPNAALNADQIIAHENATLASWFAEVKPAAEIAF
ncbi:MAG TPA: cysteine hydrolase family protein [Thermoflexales bacterium]|nr:cysteine hydrolase family protein [Thermoflexales bacterium]HQW36485.1 cysteine hydrolase family protein [Thermoflexales bacterium]HQZ20989.1 cysteine hydrolase family protein [Thermoflexales bacterium]